MQAVTGRSFPSVPAVLAGFRRRRMAREDYPGIVPDSSELVDGLLVSVSDEADLAALDRFEGEQYERCQVVVNCGGQPVSAWVYVVRAEHAHRLSDQRWDLQSFRAHFLQRFMFTYPNF